MVPENGTCGKRTNPTRGENPKRNFPERLTLATLIGIMPLNHILRKCTGNSKCTNWKEIKPLYVHRYQDIF